MACTLPAQAGLGTVPGSRQSSRCDSLRCGLGRLSQGSRQLAKSFHFDHKNGHGRKATRDGWDSNPVSHNHTNLSRGWAAQCGADCGDGSSLSRGRAAWCGADCGDSSGLQDCGRVGWNPTRRTVHSLGPDRSVELLNLPAGHGASEQVFTSLSGGMSSIYCL